MAATTTTFAFTGAQQTYVVPAGVTTLQLDCWGAAGAGGAPGGRTTGVLAVTPGETLYIYVGGKPGTAAGSSGWNGGGAGGNTNSGGGGASDVRQGGSALANRKIVAGGGGGAGSGGTYAGGAGGGTAGNAGAAYNTSAMGLGGTQTAGGAKGIGSSYGTITAGALGQGGAGSVGGGNGGGGGGGGYYGGGGGADSGAGGGGSGYVGGLIGGTLTTGYNTGNGQVTITIQDPKAPTFYNINATQTWVVPTGCTSLQVECWGAQGGSSGGLGGYSKGILTVTPGETLYINVGGAGLNMNSAYSAAASAAAARLPGGFNGGGGGGASLGTSAGQWRQGASGGGASDVRQGGSALANRKIVAGGGGGAGGGGTAPGGTGGGSAGGDGGRNTTTTWGVVPQGYGGSQTGGGGAGSGGTSGASGTGGTGADITATGNQNPGTAAGGGGGYYGGGGSGTPVTTGYVSSGAGGGSGYIGGVTSGTTTAAVQSGDGKIVLTVLNSAPNAPVLNSPAAEALADRGAVTRMGWTPSDPDTGDTQSAFDLQYWDLDSTGARVGAAHTVSGSTTNSFYDVAALTFSVGRKEWQVRTYDAAGAQGPWSPSSYFTVTNLHYYTGSAWALCTKKVGTGSAWAAVVAEKGL